MSVTIDSTIGGANANSYNSLTEFAAFCDGRLGSSAFDNASADDRTKALITATRMLERENWLGDRVNSTQRLSHPRANLQKVDQVDTYGAGYYGYAASRVLYGEVYLTTEIAPPVKEALNELALFLLAKDQQAGDATRRIKKFSVDGLAVEYDYSAPVQSLPEEIASLIAPLVMGNQLMRG